MESLFLTRRRYQERLQYQEDNKKSGSEPTVSCFIEEEDHIDETVNTEE